MMFRSCMQTRMMGQSMNASRPADAGRPCLLKAMAVFLGGLIALCTGCGLLTVQRTGFPDEVQGADGTSITRTEIDLILSNADLSDTDKATALRELGIEDELLIVVLLDL